ncbi:HD domain-containing phosphohydrolase [Dissulfurispira thermophila]|nr:HD domain-containing phosphohydrolase [Dissulfurispira thermophila]
MSDTVLTIDSNKENNRGQISLKKILHKKNVIAIIQSIINSIGSPVTIQDADGAILLAAYEGSDESGRYPINAFGEVIGWAGGSSKIAPIASILSYIAQRELEIKNITHETLNKYKEITLLYDLSEKVSSCLNLNEAATLAVEQAKKFIECTGASLRLLNGDGKLETIATWGHEADTSPLIQIGHGIEGSIFTTGIAEIVNNVLSDARHADEEVNANSMICSPLKTKDKVMGTIKISSMSPINYTAEHLKILNTIASQTAAAIENARLYDELKETFLMAVITLAETIEKRDPYTGGHTKRVMQYSLAIGKVLALSDEDMTRLKLSAILHDVGKIGVKDTVLCKPGRLTDEEFKEIKKHTLYGEEILAHIKQFKDIIPGVKHHHERYDGKGYPDGLKGKDIDIAARIIAVADSFDAMTSNRPYRQGLSLDVAFEELKKHAGAQFDPDVVSAFFASDVMEAFFKGNTLKEIII